MSIRESNGETDIFLSKFNSAGDLQWADTYGGTQWDSAQSVKADNTGYVLFTWRSFSRARPMWIRARASAPCTVRARAMSC